MSAIQVQNSQQQQYKQADLQRLGASTGKQVDDVDKGRSASVSVNLSLRVEEKEKENVDQLSAIHEKVSQLNSHMQNLNRSLQFTVDEDSGETVVTVRDSDTDKIIRQFPSEEVLEAKNAVDQMKGSLIEAKA